MAFPSSVFVRRPQKECIWCWKGMVSPEKMYNEWRVPRNKILCDTCLSLEYDDFKSVRTKRKILISSDKEAEAHLPLMMIDDAKGKTELYYDIKSLKKDLKKLDEGYRKSNIRIIERHNKNLNDYFL